MISFGQCTLANLRLVFVSFFYNARYLLLCGACAALTLGRVWAQQPQATIDPAMVQALMDRVQVLETQVQTLKSQLATVQQTKPAAAGVSDSDESVKTDESIKIKETEDEHASMRRLESHGPRLQIHGYGDVDWHASDQTGTTNSFALGQLNLFITSQLNDKFSFLAENVIEADQGTNEFGIEPERLMLIYSLNDRFNLSVGRYHTAIGYYNTAYHHSALMQTTLGRPFLFQFEDEGGILPVHNVGASATGLISSSLGLHYIAEIGNGRSVRTTISNPVQNVTDENNGKAFNLGFYVQPEAIPGLRAGFSAYHDHLSPLNSRSIHENIFAGHVIYKTSHFEFLNEAVVLRHRPDGMDETVNIPGFYSQISRQFGNYRPYFRYEYLNVPGSDPLYSDVGLLHGPIVGLRYDLNEYSALKVEYGRDMRRALPSTNTLGTQLSFAF